MKNCTRYCPRFARAALLAAVLICLSGCITANTIQVAKTKTHKSDKGETVVDEPGKPGYYALVPLTIVADVATSPIQLPFLFLIYITGYRG